MSSVHKSFIRFFQSNYYLSATFIAITPDELFKQVGLYGCCAGKQTIHDFVLHHTLHISYRDFPLKEQGEYIFNRPRALSILNPKESSEVTV